MGEVKSGKFEVPIYEYPVWVYYGSNHNVEKELRNTKDLELNLSFCNGYTAEIQYTKGKFIHKAIFIFIDSITDEYVVHHESIHAAWNILEAQGIKVSYDNHEQLTYLEMFIAKEVNKLINKWKKETLSL